MPYEAQTHTQTYHTCTLLTRNGRVHACMHIHFSQSACRLSCTGPQFTNFIGFTQKGSQRTGRNHLLFINWSVRTPSLSASSLYQVRNWSVRTLFLLSSLLYQVRNWSVRTLSLSASPLYQVRNWSVRSLSC